MPTEKRVSLHYVVDPENIIVGVGGPWDEFARQNDGHGALSDRIVGTPLLKHVSGDISRGFVEAVLNSARILNAPRSVAYRCDSPGFKRFMEMSVSPLGDQRLKILHRIVRVEPFPAPLRFAADTKQPRSSALIRCTMCNRVKGNGAWQEPDEAFSHQLLKSKVVNSVIYGICDSCRRSLLGERT